MTIDSNQDLTSDWPPDGLLFQGLLAVANHRGWSGMTVAGESGKTSIAQRGQQLLIGVSITTTVAWESRQNFGKGLAALFAEQSALGDQQIHLRLPKKSVEHCFGVALVDSLGPASAPLALNRDSWRSNFDVHDFLPSPFHPIDKEALYVKELCDIFPHSGAFY